MAKARTLTRKEVIAELSLTGPRQLDYLIENELFPAGQQVAGGRGEKVWLVKDVQAFLHLRFRGCYGKQLLRQPEKKTEDEED